MTPPQAVQVDADLQPVYDQILQETFTDADTSNGRTSPRSRSLHSPVYESMSRPPHITLYWAQSLDGAVMDLEREGTPGLRGLTYKLEEAHQAKIISEHEKSSGSSKRVLMNPSSGAEADIIYKTKAGAPHDYKGQVYDLQEQDGALPQVLRHLVREHRIKTLLLKPDTQESLTMYVNSQQFDKVVLVLKPEMLGNGWGGSVDVKRLPLRLVNTHYEFLEGSVVVTGEPCYSTN